MCVSARKRNRAIAKCVSVGEVVCVDESVCEREIECVCVCVCKNEREHVCVCVSAKERERTCAIAKCVSLRETKRRKQKKKKKKERKKKSRGSHQASTFSIPFGYSFAIARRVCRAELCILIKQKRTGAFVSKGHHQPLSCVCYRFV